MKSTRTISPNITRTGTIISPNTTPRSSPRSSSAKKRRLKSPLYVQQTRTTPEVLPKTQNAYITKVSPNQSPGTKEQHLSRYTGRGFDSYEGLGKFSDYRGEGLKSRPLKTGGKKSRKN